MTFSSSWHVNLITAPYTGLLIKVYFVHNMIILQGGEERFHRSLFADADWLQSSVVLHYNEAVLIH